MSAKRGGNRRSHSEKKRSIVPLDQLKKEHRMPVLFVGAGITRRYCDVCVWSDLLESIATKAGISQFQLNGIRQRLSSEHSADEINPLLAKEIRKALIDRISAGELGRDDFPELDDAEWFMMEHSDPFKALVCHHVSKYTLTGDPALLEELEAFRKLSSKIPAVITTNYDDFLEKHVFTDFDKLVFPDDYYFSDSSGYGEIMKIHGTVEDPDSIVITSDDYRKLESESLVILARFTSILCNNPVIFIGYSLSDPEINGIIHSIVSSLKQTQLERIRKHMVQVSVNPNVDKVSWNYPFMEHDGKRVEITRIIVPSLSHLFEALEGFDPVATPMEIKKYMSMIREIVLSADPRSMKVTMINADEIERAKPGDLAVLFGTTESVGSLMKGIVGYDISDVIEDVLFERQGLLNSKTAFIQWLSDKRICSGIKYIPVFHYIRRFGIVAEELPCEVREFLDEMVKHMESSIGRMRPDCECVVDGSEIDDFLAGQTKSFRRCHALAYFYSAGVIDEHEFRERLQTIYKEMHDEFGEDAKVPSDMRCAIAYLDYKPFKLAQKNP